MEEQVNRAELCWVLKMMSDFSFRSADNMAELMCMLDKKNKI